MNELPDAVRAMVDAPSNAHIATILPHGSPHSVPVWVGLESERVGVLTSPRSRKAQNLDRDPRVSISMTRPAAVERHGAVARSGVHADRGGRGVEDHRPHIAQVMPGARPLAARPYGPDDSRPQTSWGKVVEHLEEASKTVVPRSRRVRAFSAPAPAGA